MSQPVIATGRYTNILISSSEIGSVGVYGTTQKVKPCGEMLPPRPSSRHAGRRADTEHVTFKTYGDGAEFTACHGAGAKRHPRYPDTSPEDCRFIMHGKEVLDMALQKGPEFFAAFYPPALQRDFSEIDVVVPHQPSRAGLMGMAHFGIPEEKTITTLATLGNCVAASMPSTLYEAIHGNRLQRGDRLMLFGTGAGLSMAGALLKY